MLHNEKPRRFNPLLVVYDFYLKTASYIKLFKIFDNNTGIHNMLKYKHNTFKRKIKFIQKPFIKINGMLREINFQMKTANCEPI